MLTDKQADVRAAVRAADGEYFEQHPEVAAFERPYQPGEADFTPPPGTLVLVDRLGTNGAIRRWVIPPKATGVGKTRLS